MINVQNINDNECFKWRLIRNVNPVDHHLARIRKVDRSFGDKLDFKNIKFLVKIKDLHKFEKTNLSALVFLVIKI